MTEYEKKLYWEKKLGMTQIFKEDGTVVPVTVIQAGPCTVIQKKTVENDGYDALKVGFGEIREKLVNKPDAGQFKKQACPLCAMLRELRLDDCSRAMKWTGHYLRRFCSGDRVDVTAPARATASGVIQRWNQHTGPYGSRLRLSPRRRFHGRQFFSQQGV